MPVLNVFHKSSTVEEVGALVISMESWLMSSRILSQFALEKMKIFRGFCLMC